MHHGKGGRGHHARDKAAAVPEAIASAFASVQSFFQGGGGGKRARRGSGSGSKAGGSKPAATPAMLAAVTAGAVPTE